MISKCKNFHQKNFLFREYTDVECFACNKCLKIIGGFFMNIEKRKAFCTDNTQVGFHTGNGTTDNKDYNFKKYHKIEYFKKEDLVAIVTDIKAKITDYFNK